MSEINKIRQSIILPTTEVPTTDTPVYDQLLKERASEDTARHLAQKLAKTSYLSGLFAR